MRFDSFRHHRRTIRLKGYNYAAMGAYYVTICTKNRECLFGNVVDGVVRVNDAGRMVNCVWHELIDHFPTVTLDTWVVMPNHVHGIIWITNGRRGGVIPPSIVGRDDRAPTFVGRDDREGRDDRAPTLGNIVAYYKYRTTKLVNDTPNTENTEPIWQRNYYERIIRNDAELNGIRQYIQQNPANWDQDPENIKID